jgi:hypothetical protein
MNTEQKSNLAASVHQRLLNRSRKRGEDFNNVLVRYANERLLYRITKSEHASRFVLKGAMLFAVWTDEPYRPTRDVDLLGYGDSSREGITALFEAICQADVEPDGLEFDPTSVTVIEIREHEEYDGLRVRLTARLEGEIAVQVDVGFGDIVTPDATEIDYPTLLEFPAPHLLAYPPETFVAEKLQAIVALGMPNSRMKDFYDLRVIAREFAFDGPVLAEAVKATFERRGTPIPRETPVALSEEFATDHVKVAQWQAFLQRSRLEDGSAEDLKVVIAELCSFALPIFEAATDADSFKQVWTGKGGWTARR